MAMPADSAKLSGELIALDWGTTSLRAYLLGAKGETLEHRSAPWGVMRVPAGGFRAAFDRMTLDWRERTPSIVAIAAGMIGSAQGWIEAPYCAAPAGAAELARQLTAVPSTPLLIVPGVVQRGASPDVMRGEETQIVGCLALRPELAERALLLLPGTHSKWARVASGRVREFTTFLTGELFDVLCTHSILGRLAREAAPGLDGAGAAAAEAFRHGVITAREAPNGMAPLLFSARAKVLTGSLDATLSLEYLSGLLIGDELRCGLSTAGAPDALVGDTELCARYAAALAMFDVHELPVLADSARPGLWSIAQHASLVAPTGSGVIA